MNLTISQLKYMLVLSSLSEAGDIKIADIAKFLNIKRSSAFNMLNRLLEAGVIIKNNDKTVSLTDEGKRVSKELRKKVNDMEIKLIECFKIDISMVEDCALAVIYYSTKTKDIY
ncbi:hypothetical protein IMSAG049_00128 [Clostridiales bacterium]|nr:hypothetical protein IMSAG049_00128 [Clostridiales bacterium]